MQTNSKAIDYEIYGAYMKHHENYPVNFKLPLPKITEDSWVPNAIVFGRISLCKEKPRESSMIELSSNL